MRFKLSYFIGALAIAATSLVPASAYAERIYFLVGVRHVYEIGPDRDAHLQDREEIEKNYADGVATDQDTFNKHVADGADRQRESDMLDKDLDALAEARDNSLGSLFERRDDLRDTHPELRVQVDGPYQVIGVEMHAEGTTEVFDRYIVYAPWPGYVVVGGCYGGWDYGVWYTPGIFFDLYLGWWNGWGGGRFCGGFYGHGGVVAFAPHGFVDHWGAAHGFGGGFGRSVGGYSHGYASAARTGGYSHSYGATRGVTSYAHSAASGYTHSGSTGYSRSASSSAAGYGHSTGTYSRSATSSSSGYTHSTSSYGRSSSSYGRTSSTYGSSRSSYGSSGASRSSGGGYSRSGSSHGSNSGGGSHGGGSSHGHR